MEDFCEELEDICGELKAYTANNTSYFFHLRKKNDFKLIRKLRRKKQRFFSFITLH